MSSAAPTKIEVSPAALVHIRNQLAHTQASYLRLGLKESGCNGFMYMLDFLEAPASEDLIFEFADDVKVCVAKADQHMILGTEIDMLSQGLNTALVFKNPQATSYCGCGESFAVDGSPEPDDLDIGDLATNVGQT